MSSSSRCARLAEAFVAGTVALAGAVAVAADAPPEVATALVVPRLHGEATMRFVGLRIYDARLWTGTGFDPARYAQQPFALELRYARALEGTAIAERSIDEMRRAGPLPEVDAERWRQAMRTAFPDVQPGDRLIGVHAPGAAVRFLHNGRATATIDDAEFARRFFGIWLAPTTSEPALRQRLLGIAP